MNLRTPLAQSREDLIPLIVYKNGQEQFEVSSYAEAIRRMLPLVTCGIKELRNAVWDSAFNLNNWNYNGNVYQFRTNEERRKLGVIKRKKIMI